MDDPASICRDQIEYTFMNRDGTLWVGATNGLSRYSSVDVEADIILIHLKIVIIAN